MDAAGPAAGYRNKKGKFMTARHVIQIVCTHGSVSHRFFKKMVKMQRTYMTQTPKMCNHKKLVVNYHLVRGETKQESPTKSF